MLNYIIIFAIYTLIIIGIIRFINICLERIKRNIKLVETKVTPELKLILKAKVKEILDFIKSMYVKKLTWRKFVACIYQQTKKSTYLFYLLFLEVIKIWTKNNNVKNLVFFILTMGFVSIFFVSSLQIYTPMGSVISFLSVLCGLWVLGAFTLTLSKLESGFLENLLYLFSCLIFLFLMATVALSLFEKIKNAEIDSIGWYVAFPFALYIISLLCGVMKNILNRGNTWLSVVGGISIYIFFIFFTTVATGFYLTSSNPSIVETNQFLVMGHKPNDFLTYALSYSYIGAKYLLQLPSSNDFISIEVAKGTINNMIPYSYYIAFFVGLFINIVILAYFVSYAVSIYLLKITDKKGYNDVLKKSSIEDKYVRYLKWKLKMTGMIIWKILIVDREQILQKRKFKRLVQKV